MTQRPVETTMADMVHRFRLLAASLALILALGVVYAGASMAASARISAHLTSKSFTAAQARSVKVQYKFSSKSSRFGYVLSRKAGSAWSRVRSVSKRGSFRGSHTLTVKSVFGSKPITAGKYRLKLSSSAHSVTLGFKVTPPKTVTPQAGRWRATSLTGPVSGSAPSGNTVTAKGLFFDVASSQQTVSAFGFSYEYSGPSKVPPSGPPCSGSGDSVESAPSPISNGEFHTPGATGAWSGAASGTFHGTFDSPTTAHGTAQMSAFVGGSGCFFSGTSNTGTFNWTATREG